MKRYIFILLITISVGGYAQNTSEDRIKTTNFPELKKIMNPNIPGAPILSQPQQIKGTVQEIRTEKHGLVYPAFFDWNGDGRKDLLLGEFETGETGSYIKVYLNEGTDEAPVFSGEYFYATDINGDIITNFQWCCIGIHPRIMDFDGDGYPDMLSGQYNPGAISLWRGSKDGFLPRVFIEQEGYIDSTTDYFGNDPTSPESNTYWNYTSADFADFNGDGLLDLFVSGSGGPRVALNVGTNGSPKFGLREYLHHTDGTLLSINREKTDEPGRPSVGKSYLHPVDWDGDGVLDILMTHEYSKPEHNPIEFFKGVRMPEGLRFEKPVPLFTAEDGTKALPGCQPMITIIDYNNDGIQDIVFGISIPTVNGFDAAPEIAWEWIHKLGIQMPGKDVGRYSGGDIEGMIKKIEENPVDKKYHMGNLDDYKYLTMRHRGYVFVIYGTENPVKTQPVTMIVSMNTGNNTQPATASQNPVNFTIDLPEEIVPGREYTARVIFSFGEGWHGYADDKGNGTMDFIPTTAEFLFPDGAITGNMVISSRSKIYKGSGVSFSQTFTYPEKRAKKDTDLTVTVKLQWQVCDENMCMPPENHTLGKTIKIKK